MVLAEQEMILPGGALDCSAEQTGKAGLGGGRGPGRTEGGGVPISPGLEERGSPAQAPGRTENRWFLAV